MASKEEQELGWKAELGIEEMIRDTRRLAKTKQKHSSV
jgi:hypothetical protein